MDVHHLIVAYVPLQDLQHTAVPLETRNRVEGAGSGGELTAKEVSALRGNGDAPAREAPFLRLSPAVAARNRITHFPSNNPRTTSG